MKLHSEKVRKIIFLVSFWIIVTVFYVFYDWSIYNHDVRIMSSSGIPAYDLSSAIISTLLATIVGGVFIASIEVFYFSKLLRKVPFGLSLLIKTVFYFINIMFFTSAAIMLGSSMQYNKPLFHPDIIDEYLSILSSPRLLSIWMLWGFTVIIALFILQISEKLGQGVLINYLLGKYHKPREELRIFMFLDLKSSTSLAERLGHIKYSQLIQDCFFDLTDVVAKNDAQIYQYVGDEVVLTWKMNSGLKDNNCLNVYFDYTKAINSRKAHYLSKYGVVPEFKAGLDGGLVTVAEVGEIKKELAYHGDVLNTASRIQGMCNQYQATVLLSERLTNQFNGITKKEAVLIGKLNLRGKDQATNVYSIGHENKF
jgi:adenylate cyclase